MHGHEDVLVDKLDETAFIFLGVATTVDDTHLFDECALSRFPRSCGKKNVNNTLAISMNGFRVHKQLEHILFVCQQGLMPSSSFFLKHHKTLH